MTLRRSSPLLLLVVLGWAAACSSGEERPAAPPPGSKDEVVQAFGPALDKLGLRITRAGLVARAGVPGYTPTGRHLAVYVEPLGQVDVGTYVTNLMPVAKAFLPEVFDRYGQIDSFDVCQEPAPGVDDRPEPPPVTQLLISRANARSLDWQSLDLKGLVAAQRPDGLNLGVASQVSTSPAWARAVA